MLGMKTNGGYNGRISVQTPIFHLVVNSKRLKTVRSAVRRCPKLHITLRVFKNVAKVTNLAAVKIQFHHLFLSSFFSQPSTLTRAIPNTKHPRIVIKFPWNVHFELIVFSETAISKQQFDEHDPMTVHCEQSLGCKRKDTKV